MTVSSAPLSPATEANIKSILAWLAMTRDHSGSDDAEQLHRQLLKLRGTPMPIAERCKLLDLLYDRVERLVKAELPGFQKMALPVANKMRLRIKRIVGLLEIMTQDYSIALTELLGPADNDSPHNALLRAMQCITWQIKIDHLVAAPTGVGLWRQLHALFRTARRHRLETLPDPRGNAGIARLYSDILLATIAQPASFSASELEFINDYIEGSPFCVELSDTPPIGAEAVFWIDLERDIGAHALIRRLPAAESQPLYFACDAIATEARRQLDELERGASAADLKLPPFAETRAGRGVLRRLADGWGKPARRRFPRRRQAYRANLCLGLDSLWRLMRHVGNPVPLSEWMVTNESPEGYALMHVGGDTDNLRIGDVVAVQAIDERHDAPWHICLIRWAISENPEHIELGLQLLAPRAIAAEIAQPGELDAGCVAVLILPETPPLRPSESLLTPPGKIERTGAPLILLVERDNLLIREIRAGNLDGQTGSIELFSVVARDDSV
ncbi:MAG: hypothetical protein FWC58_09575 [Desulfobulbus sp.]|nr:hypothetical protein [Desulfobulbus sp.]